MIPVSTRHAVALRASCRIVLGVLLGFALLAARAEEALSLDEALRLAQQRSHQLVAHDRAATAARLRALAARRLPDPTLRAGIDNLPVDGADRFSLTRDFMTMRTIGVMQEITHADKRQARAARLDREAQAAGAGRALALASLRRDTALAWLERHFQERVRGLLRLQRAEAALQIDAAEAAYRGGRGALADVFAARAALAWLADRERQAELAIATATTRLARWVGADAARALAAPPGMATVPLDAATLEVRLIHDPEIALRGAEEALARADADVARSERHADWSVEVALQQRGGAYANMVSLNLSIPLQWDRANRQDRELAARLATAEQMRAQREEATRERVAEALGWLQQWHGHRDRLAHYDSTLIPLAEERIRAALAAYRGGAGPLAAALEARRLALEVALERLRLESETAGLWARLEHLLPADASAPAADHPPAREEPQ